MEKTKSEIKEFKEAVEKLAADLGADKGYVLFAYNEMEKNIESSFSSKGKLSSIAECLYLCMKENQMLANVVMAACNAIAQNRMVEAQILAEAKEQGKKVKKSKKKEN